MSKARKLLDLVLSGHSDQNIPFKDLCRLLESLGFTIRVRGSHHIFVHTDIPDMLNLQRDGNKAKPYQVKQVRRLIQQYRLMDS